MSRTIKEHKELEIYKMVNDCEAETTETQTWIEFAVKCNYLNVEIGRELYGTYNRVLDGLVSMINNPSPWLIKR